MKMELKSRPPLIPWHHRKAILAGTGGLHSWLTARWNRLANWLFSWHGLLLCIAVITLLLGAEYGLAFSNAFRSSWLLPLIAAALSMLAVTVMVGGLLWLTKTLVSAQHQVTQLQQDYEQERELNQAQNQVLHTLNHEMRIPLTQVQGYLELLETCETQLDPATRAHFIAQANSGCEELLSLLTTVMATGTNKSEPLQMQVFSLHHEVQTVVAHLDPRILEDHRLQLDIPASLLVWADPRLLRQIMRNLLTNALKYSPPHKYITVSASLLAGTEEQDTGAGKICIRVSDEGLGIPLEQQSLLFQRFVRLPNALASGQPGTGLGLAICKQLVETMGGCIWLESPTHMGKGCCFSFTLTSGAALVISPHKIFVGVEVE